MMNNLSATQGLFATLKPDDGTSTTAVNEASHSAEQRWPLLKSLGPEKWSIAPTLSEEEKLNRKQLEPMPTVARRPAASEPNINTQLANALNRMIEPKPTTEASISPMPLPMPTPAHPSSPPSGVDASLPKQEGYSPALPFSEPPVRTQEHKSIASILNRIERAHMPAPTTAEKIPAFLARLGKR
jgi:hypothetical protein